jgi:hypothetical protein
VSQLPDPVKVMNFWLFQSSIMLVGVACSATPLACNVSHQSLISSLLSDFEWFVPSLGGNKRLIRMDFEEMFFLCHESISRESISIVFHWILPVQVFFKRWRHMDAAKRPKPVMVHLNYHPNKEERMDTIIKYFRGGDAGPMMKLPGGSQAGT